MDSPSSLAARFGITGSETASCSQFGGGFSGATVLKWTSERGNYALRGWPAGIEVRRLLALHRLLQHVAADGLPVAVPLTDTAGRRLVEIDHRWWQVEPWLPGVADYRASPSDEKLSAAMAVLAAFHKSATSFDVPVTDRQWFGGPVFGPAPAVLDRREHVLQPLLNGDAAAIKGRLPPRDRGDFAELARSVLREFERLAGPMETELVRAGLRRVPLTPVLRDVWHDHVLFTDHVVTGLIDPSASRRDTVTADLARLLRSMVGSDGTRWNQAIDCYERHRRLTDDEHALIRVLDRSGVLLSAMTWLRRRYLLNANCDQPAVLGRLRELVGQLEPMDA